MERIEWLYAMDFMCIRNCVRVNFDIYCYWQMCNGLLWSSWAILIAVCVDGEQKSGNFFSNRIPKSENATSPNNDTNKTN